MDGSEGGRRESDGGGIILALLLLLLRSSRRRFFFQGASIKYVCKVFGFLDPLPLCPQIHSTSLTELYYKNMMSAYKHNPPPPSARTYLLEAPTSLG